MLSFIPDDDVRWSAISSMDPVVDGEDGDSTLPGLVLIPPLLSLLLMFPFVMATELLLLLLVKVTLLGEATEDGDAPVNEDGPQPPLVVVLVVDPVDDGGVLWSTNRATRIGGRIGVSILS